MLPVLRRGFTVRSPGGWRAGAGLLPGMHRRWEGRAAGRWPWLRPVAAGADLVARLFDQAWPQLAGRGDLTAMVQAVGARLAGRVAEAARAVAGGGAITLVHGDASALNMRTGPGGEVVLLDWEDVSAAPGILNLGWLLSSSVEPARWNEVIAALRPGRWSHARASRCCGAGPAQPVRHPRLVSGRGGLDHPN
jgi:Phosphotransferase enzyme family